MLAFATLVSSSIAANVLGKACTTTYYTHRLCNLENSAGFLVFLSLVVAVYEAAVIVARFLNFNFVSVFNKAVSIVVSVKYV